MFGADDYELRCGPEGNIEKGSFKRELESKSSALLDRHLPFSETVFYCVYRVFIVLHPYLGPCMCGDSGTIGRGPQVLTVIISASTQYR